MENSTFNRIYDVVKQIPYGKVATYGQVATLAGSKRWARVDMKKYQWNKVTIDSLL